MLQMYKNFYYNGDYSIYGDVWNKVPDNFFGRGMARKVLYEIDKYYDYLDKDKYVDFRDFIDKNIDDLNNKLNNIDILFEDGLDIGGVSMIIQLVNGTSLIINTSEWGSIKRL